MARFHLSLFFKINNVKFIMAMGRAVTPNTWAAHSREASKDSGHHPSADGHWHFPFLAFWEHKSKKLKAKLIPSAAGARRLSCSINNAVRTSWQNSKRGTKTERRSKTPHTLRAWINPPPTDKPSSYKSRYQTREGSFLSSGGGLLRGPRLGEPP